MSAELIIRRFDTLKSNRGTWENHWQEVADLMFPNHPMFIGDRSPGTKDGLKMYDGSPVHASEMLAAGLHGFLTNPASEWFVLQVSDPALNARRQVRMWLDDVQRRMYKEITNSKTAFSTHIHEMYLEFGVFGTGVLFTGENMSRDGIVFKAIPLSNAYIAENEDGIVDTLYRIIKMSVRQIMEKWPETASEKVQKHYRENKLDELCEVIHAVEPDPKGTVFRFKSVYVERSEKNVLAESGFKSFPYSVPRFYKASGEIYGRGPGITALPDVKILNQMMKTTIKAAQKIVDPPLQAPDDGFLNPIRTVPGGINYFRQGTKERIEPLITGANIPIGLEMMEALRQHIQRVFFVDLLELPHKAERVTATEIMQRTEDKMRVMGPILGRMQAEALDTIVQRVFQIMLDQGKFAEPPIDLSETKVTIDYVSPIARAQKQLEAGGLQRVLEVMTPFISGNPEILTKFDTDVILTDVSEMFGLRPEFIKSPEQIQQEQQAKEQQAQMAQMAETMKTGSEAAVNLQQVVGGQGGGQI